MGVEAWVTTAVEDRTAEKAIVLAGSLRRVRTAKKLVVLTTLEVSKKLRDKLENVFDLATIFEPKTSNGLETAMNWGKVHALSMTIFEKCVYLSPNTMVIKNCDEIFDKRTAFAACLDDEDDFDSSVWLFTPNSKYKWVERDWHNEEKSKRGSTLSQTLMNWLMKKGITLEKLDEKYNFKLFQMGEGCRDLDVDASIVNFGNGHPLDTLENCDETSFGVLETKAVNICFDIYKQDVTRMQIMERYDNEPIAIVGLSLRLPAANDVNEFWDLLIQGKEGIQTVPPYRWLKQHSYYPCRNRRTEAGFLNVPIDMFDAKFFGISPKDAEYLDPQLRLLHEVSWEALEDAMIDPMSLKGTQTSFYVGSWMYDYQSIAANRADLDFLRLYTGNSVAATAARLSHFYGTTGPSVGTESGCSSGMVAVHMACKSLQNRESELSLACGVNLIIHPFEQSMLSFVVAPDARCKAFDSRADGFGRAEGCAVLVMKRLSDATRDGDSIWGLLRGSAIRQEGTSKSLGTPTVHCESLAMELSLKDAGVHPKDVSYIEAHGTGTPVGDPLEIAAITKAYSKGREEPLVIGSVKTNVGHTESVSGITGIIKVLLSLKNEVIPKHLHLENINPDINLSLIPAEIPLEPVSWPRTNDKRRIAGVSSFGISGTDGHVIIEEPPPTCATLQPQICFQERPLHILKLSAKSTESLNMLIQRYQERFLENGSEKEFADIVYSANLRSTFNHRVVVTAKNCSDAAKILEERTFKQAVVQPSSENKLCFLFTGQGSQYPNMASSLYETSPVFKHYFDKSDVLLKSIYNLSLKSVLWGTDSHEINRTIYSQTSIFCVEYALFKLWESWGVKPDYVVGHSLGEFAAAVASGSLTFEDALKLVAERSKLIDKLPNGKMLVIKADKQAVDDLIRTYQQNNKNFWVDFAAINSSDQTVVAGDPGWIESFSKFCETKNLKTIILAATHAFHSRHMDPMLDSYREIAATVKKPKKRENLPKYISGMEGKLVEIDFTDAEYWVRHTRKKVSFKDACKAIQSEGCKIFLELGPHPVLSALAMVNIEGEAITCLPSLRRKEEDWTTMLDSLSKLYLSDWKGEIDWLGFDRFYSRNRVSVPFYPFNRKSIWTKVQRLYPKVHPLLGRIHPTASSDTVYENVITLKNTSYLQDHVIGNSVIVPGAAFLETCLAGGHVSVQGLSENMIKPRRPVVLRNLQITSPLALNDTDECLLQTVVRLDSNQSEDEIGYSVGVYHHLKPEDDESGIGKFIHHASATYVPVAPSLDFNPLEPIDIESIKASPKEFYDAKEFYEKAPEAGLRFGPRFQSLKHAWETETGILESVKITDDQTDYLVHPIIIDAMIQALYSWTHHKDNKRNKLWVPVQVSEFILISPVDPESSDFYVYCSNNEKSGKTYCFLLNEHGKKLVYMEGVDYIQTNVKLIEGMIQQHRAALPKLWKDVWRNFPGPLQNSLNVDTVIERTLNEETVKHVKEISEIPIEEKLYCEVNSNLALSYVLNALFTLGWKPEMNSPFSVDSLMSQLGINKRYRKYLIFFLKSIAKQKNPLLEIVGDVEFNWRVAPPTKAELLAKLEQVSNPKYKGKAYFEMIREIGKNLDGLFTDKIEPLSLLFPDDPEKASAAKCYESMIPWITDIQELVSREFFTKFVNTAVEKYNNGCTSSPESSPVLRVLEVGGGSGLYPKLLLDIFESSGWKFEYYFTDVSAAFFIHAEKYLEKHLSSIKFQKFDMERDPLEQGLCPEYFDVIIACEVLHVSEDITHTLKNLHSLLKPGGLIQIIETITADPRVTFMFGLLDGYWRFKDREHATLTAEMWEKKLQLAGYERFYCTPYYNNLHGIIYAFKSSIGECHLKELYPQTNTWLIFDDETEITLKLKENLERVNRKVVVVKRPTSADAVDEDAMRGLIETSITTCLENSGTLEGILYLWGLSSTISECDQRLISLPFVSLCQAIWANGKLFPKIFAVTQGICLTEDGETTNPNPGTLGGLVRSISNEISFLKLHHFDFSPNDGVTSIVNEIFYNLWVDTGKLSITFRGGNRYSLRLVSRKFDYNEPLFLPNGCDRFQLVVPKTRMISDLEYTNLDQYTLEENEIEVKVAAMALNFRDVFTVLKPIKIFEEYNTVGMEFSGTITKIGSKVTTRKVGDRVIGANFHRNLAMPSHIKLEEHMVVPLKDDMTFVEGTTVPIAFSTASYCLLSVANMKQGETVLIHTASGGVGLCAIQVAQHVGAKIIATAGSSRKRNYLRNLGIKHVFNSRTTDFGKEIMEATGGEGVHIVLNSLTGPGFKEASLNGLRKNGRFIEMSKLNVWTEEEVKDKRPDVFYKIVDMASMEKCESEKVLEELDRYLRSDFVKPVAYERFDALNIRGALNYLQKAKHIGKIVCVMPEVKIERSYFVVTTPLFSDDSTYVVTGGLGGIGWEVVKWMLKNGARHIAILSRSTPNQEVTAQIKSWNTTGKNVHAFPVDVGNYDDCKKVFESFSSEFGLPNVRGVMHVAGVIKDALLENQTWSNFYETYNAKVYGTWNLHNLTKNLLLEHFVLFSSIAATLGSPGQANHSASNSFEDALASYRRSIGLPAICINWGNWGEVGVATDIDFPGIRPISTSQGLLALETFLKTQTSHMSVLNVESLGPALKLYPNLKHYIDDKRLLGEVKSALIVNTDEFWQEVDSAPDHEGRIEVFKKYIKITVKNILKMNQDEEIDDSADFQSLGIDSLMMLEMKNGMQNVLGVRMTVSVNQLKDCNNTQQLAKRLVEILEGDGSNGENIPDMEELKALIKKDSKIVPNISKDKKCLPIASDINTILLTGATGNMGLHILKDLSQRSQIKKIYCLIRPVDGASITSKLQGRLESAMLLDEVDMDKVEYLEGDIIDGKLGLNEVKYTELAVTIDAVIHCAALVDHSLKYWNGPETSRSCIRSVNVLGTRNVLEFAGVGVTKHVMFPSTLIAITEVDEEGHLSETWQDVGALDEVKFNSGYALSKHVSEQIIRHTMEEYDVPCKVFRFPYIGSSSQTGKLELDSDLSKNLAVLRWLCFMKLGCMPDLISPICAVAVDRCSKVAVDVFLNPKAPLGVYNVMQREIEMEHELVDVAKEFGIKLGVVPYLDFTRKLKLLDEASPFAPVRKLYEEGESVFLNGFESRSIESLKSFLEKSGSIVKHLKLSEYAHGYENGILETTKNVMRRDLFYLKESGIFEKYGIIADVNG